MRKHNRISWLTTVLLAVLAGSVLAQEKKAPDATVTNPALPGALTLAKFDKAPEIDGKLDEGEWDRAARLEGFLASGGSPWGKWSGTGWLEPRAGHTLLGFTADRLYFAVVSELPPDQELVTKQDRNEVVNTVGDDSIEIWVWDPKVADTQYQMITNSVGATFDIRHSATSSDQGWNGGWKIANTIDKEKNVWISEISVPFAAFGLSGDVVGREIGLLLARNYKRPWSQATAMPASITFRTPDSYGRLRLTENDPVVRVERIGQYGGHVFGPLYDQANLDLQLRIINPGPARKARVTIGAQSTDMPERGDDKTVDLPANGVAEYAFKIPPNTYHNTASHMVNFSVTDEQGQSTWLKTGFMWTIAKDAGWKKRRDNTWQVKMGPQPELATRIWYYPSYDRLRVFIDPSFLGRDFKDPHKAEVTVTGDGGKVLLKQSIAWEKAPHLQWLDVPKLDDGKYVVSIKIEGYDEPLVNNFARKHFAWEGNKLGITDEVLPPFTPITVEGDTVGVVLRKYEMTGLGFWKSIQARGQDQDDQYRELLTGPIVLVADGDQVLEGKGAFTKKAPNHVVYEGSAEHPAVTAKVKSTIEEDGCMRVELTLAPGIKQQELKNLSLRIPLKDKLAPLYHVSSTTLRTNPAGATPAGQGKVWDSYSYPTGIWYENFHPYIWLGAESRGLCWFADNDKGWVIDANLKEPEKAMPPQELIREGDTLILKVNLVQKPVVLDKEHHIVFGLMASPAKPLPADWRAMGRKGGQRLTFTMGRGFGLPATFSAKYPLNGDLSSFDVAQAYRKGENLDREAYIDGWVKRNVPADAPDEVKENFALSLKTGLGKARSAGNGYLSVYFDEFHSTSMFMKEAPFYYSEWSGKTLPKRFTEKFDNIGYFAAGFNTAGIVPTYRDFAVYHGAEWIKRGFGLYFDNAFPIHFDDPLTSSAYELPNGEIQPSAGMWARREYLRRIWTLHQQLSPKDTPAMMYIHMTNTHIVPYMVWNQANLDLEWKVSTQPLQSKFAPDLIRAESLGLQSGNIPTAFSTVRGDRESQRVSQLALLVHEIHMGLGTAAFPTPINEFGYGLPDCKVTRYWDENPSVSVSDDNCKWLLLERGGQRMIVLATWNSEPSEVAIRLKDAPAGASDADSNEALQVSNGVLTVPMKGFGARIIHLK